MPVLVFKTIKPKRLQEKEMKRVIRNAMKRVGYGIQKDFESTTATWDHKPKFSVTTTISGDDSPAVLVGTDDEIYGYVSGGTSAHIIRPKRARALRFQKTYTAKTVPGVIGSKAGGPSGPAVYAQEVHHPGTKARRFDQIIQKKWQPRFKREIEAAMKEARLVSGNAL